MEFKKLNVIHLKVSDLIAYENNPRKNDDAVDAVASSIKSFGFKVPVIVDSNNVIIAGHTRVKACKKLGITEVPCVIADDLTEDQIKAFRLADNKTSEFAEWDFEKLEEELRELNFSDIDMSLFNFDLSFEDELEPKEDEEKAPESFDEYDEEIETKHQCPKCGYEWS